MGTIADKLTYLNGTKQAIKQAINEDFEVIDNNTTFREYADEISSNNAKYKDLIPKVNVNGINNIDISNSSGLDKALVTQYGNTKQSILPSEYTQVDYIQSSGSQYIDAGINADTKLRVVVDMAYLNYSLANQNIGAIKLGTPNARYHLLPSTSDINFWVNNDSYKLGTADNNRHLIDMNVPDGQVLYDNNVITIPTNIRDTELNFWLFGRNSTEAKYFAQMRLWNCKMYYNGNLVRDFIPCYRNSDNEVGLYDLVNNVFYTNQGTGVFTYGSKIPNPDYPQEIVNISGKSTIKVVGKNKLPFPYTQASSTLYGVTFTVQNDGSVLVNGTANGGNANIKLYGNYLTIDNKELPGKYISGGTNEVSLRVLNNIDGSYTLLANDTGNGAEIDTSTYKKGYIELLVRNGTTVNNVLIKPMVLDSLDDITYEAYQEQSFDIDLKSKNLFDKNNANTLVGYVSSAKISGSSQTKTVYIPCKPNTTYTISKILSSRFAVGTTINTPVVNETVVDYSTNNTSTSITITTSSNTNYLCVFYYHSTYDTTITEQQILDSIQIEENSTATEYEPFYDINLCKIGDYKDRIKKSTGKNLFDKNNANILHVYVNSSTNTITGTSLENGIFYIPCKPNTTYTVSKTRLFGEDRFCVFDTANIPKIGDTILSFVGTRVGYDGSTSLTITTKKDANYLGVFVKASETSPASSLEEIANTIQIEENPTPTDYEPFGKVWYLEKKIGNISFSDSDLSSCSVNGISSAFVEYLSPIIDDIKPGMGEASQVSLSNITNMFRGTTSTKKIRFRISHEILGTTSTSTNAEAKTALLNKMSDKTMICYYVLATPTTTEITESNYPTLYEQLNNIKLYEEVNHLTFTNESGLDVEFDIEYYKDWKLD